MRNAGMKFILNVILAVLVDVQLSINLKFAVLNLLC